MTALLRLLLSALLLRLLPLFMGLMLPSVQAGAAPLPENYLGVVNAALLDQSMPLRQQLQFMRDDSGQLDGDAAMHDDGWHNMSADGLIGGYSKAAIWLRGSLRNSSDVTLTRWIAIGSARLAEVDFFRFSPTTAQAVEVQHSGTRVALARRPLPSHIPLFAITLAPGERVDFAARVRSDSALDVSVTLWEPAAFRQAEGLELTLQALLICISLLMAIYALAKGIIWRDRAFSVLALWVMLSMGYIVSFQGYLYRYLFPDGSPLIVRAPSTFAALSSMAFVWMILSFVPLRRLRGWHTVYLGALPLMAGAALWTALGDYQRAAPVSNLLLGIFYLVWIVSMLHAWWRRLPNAALFLLSFSPVWLIMFVKILELNGLLGRRWMPDVQLSWLFQLGLLPMMTLLVIGRSLHLYRRHQQMQQDLIDAQAQEQSRLEHAVAERTRELSEALIAADEANHAKTDFLARISHDLRTPLTSILGFADMVQAGSNEHAGHGRIIRRSAHHMLNMVNDLIDYARGDNAESLQVAPTYVHALVQTIAQEGAEMARRRNNRFTCHIEGELPPVLQLDAKRLHRMLANLLDNAAKYTHDGSIEMLVQCQTRQASHASHASHESGDDDAPLLLSFRIKDSGSGIPESHQQRVFEPFERARSARGQPGIGLGLAIVKQWITRMHGTVTLESVEGLGTAIVLALPTHSASEQSIARHHVLEATSMAPLIDGSGYLVWVVEDSPEIAQLLSDQLSSLGFAVATFADGTEVIAHMAAAGSSAPPALLLTDYQMPGADGAQVLQAARRHLPGVPVVLLSATARGMADTAFDASLLKPINFLDLQEALGRLLKLDKLLPSGDAHEHQAQDEQTWSRPPAKLLRQGHHLIDLGAISDLIDWAETLHADYPQHQDFYRRARQLIDQGNLAALAQLCQLRDQDR